MPIQLGEIPNILFGPFSGHYQHYLSIYVKLHPHLFGTSLQDVVYLHYSEDKRRQMQKQTALEKEAVSQTR